MRVLVVLVSKSGQVYPGAFGLPEPWNTRRSMPLSHSMSLQVAADGRPMVVRDAREDPALRDRFAVREMAIAGFAAMPLMDAHGRPIGVLSVGDERPRDWTDEELRRLRRLADETSALLRVRALELAEREARAAAERADDAARKAAVAAQAAFVAAEAAADRARVVARLSQELLPAETLPDVLRSVDRFLRSPLGAAFALLGLAETGRADLRVWALLSSGPPSRHPLTGLELTSAHPLSTAVRERRPVPVATRAEAETWLGELVGAPVGAETSLAVPLVMGQHSSSGGLLVGWGDRRELDTQLRRVIGDLAGHVGHAVDRVLLRDQRIGLTTAPPQRPGTA